MNPIPKRTLIISAAAALLLIVGSIVFALTVTNSRQVNEQQRAQAAVLNRLDDVQNGVSVLLRTSPDTDEYFAANRFPTLSGAEGDGWKDVTEILKNELAAASETGGTVYLPQGTYLISGPLTIPSGVTLRGDFHSPESKQISDAKTLLTVSGIKSENESAEPLITVEDGAALIGITVFYEDQAPDRMIPCAPSVACRGDAILQDITLLNPYIGITLEGNASATLRRIWMSPLQTGVQIAKESGFAWLEDVYVSPSYWLNSHPETFTEERYSAMNRYQHENLKAIVLEGAADAVFCRLHIEGAAEGMSITVPTETSGTIRVTETTVSATNTPVSIASLPSKGILISDSSFRPESDAGADCIRIGSEVKAPVLFSSCIFAGLPKTVVRAQNNDLISFYHCSFGTWWNTCFDVTFDTFLVNAPVFRSNERLANLGQGGLGVLYAGPELELSDQLLFSISGSSAADTGTTTIRFGQDASKAPDGGAVLNALDFGLSTAAEDNSEPLKNAFDALKETRGVVFLPEGVYRFSSPVAVPENVRLIGVGNRETGYRTTLLFSPENPDVSGLVTLGKDAALEQLQVRLDPSCTVSETAFAVRAEQNACRLRNITVSAPRGIALKGTAAASAEHLQLNVTQTGLELIDAVQTQIRDATINVPSDMRIATGIRIAGGSVGLSGISIYSAACGIERTESDAAETLEGTLITFFDTETCLYGESSGSAVLTNLAVTGDSTVHSAAIVAEGVGSTTLQGALLAANNASSSLFFCRSGTTEIRAALLTGFCSTTLHTAETAVARLAGCIWEYLPEQHAVATGQSRVTMVANLLRSEAEFAGVEANYLQTGITEQGEVEGNGNVIKYRYIDPDSFTVPETPGADTRLTHDKDKTVLKG